MFLSGSQSLFEATGLTFGTVSVTVPSSWTKCGSYLIQNTKGYTAWNTSTIRVGRSHPIFGEQPWTQQPRGCGLQGDFISLSSDWLTSTNVSDTQRGKWDYLNCSLIRTLAIPAVFADSCSTFRGVYSVIFNDVE